MTALATINPFLAARRFQRVTPAPRPRPERHHEREQPVYAKLPQAPRTASPVPHLTSLYHNAEAGPYGDRGYPGNCSGNLIRDLIQTTPLVYDADGLPVGYDASQLFGPAL